MADQIALVDCRFAHQIGVAAQVGGRYTTCHPDKFALDNLVVSAPVQVAVAVLVHQVAAHQD